MHRCDMAITYLRAGWVEVFRAVVLRRQWDGVVISFRCDAPDPESTLLHGAGRHVSRPCILQNLQASRSGREANCPRQACGFASEYA
jgi:hypothetical protein